MHVAEKKRLTEDGLKKIEQELENLKTVRRKEIAEKIKVALSFGDWSENSEYDEAKNEQEIIEAKITQLEAMLKVVEVVDTDELSTDIVGVGSKVRILDMDMDEEEEYQIVGSAEADPMENRISDESPPSDPAAPDGTQPLSPGMPPQEPAHTPRPECANGPLPVSKPPHCPPGARPLPRRARNTPPPDPPPGAGNHPPALGDRSPLSLPGGTRANEKYPHPPNLPEAASRNVPPSASTPPAAPAAG